MHQYTFSSSLLATEMSGVQHLQTNAGLVLHCSRGCGFPSFHSHITYEPVSPVGNAVD